jgi:hypothetical protein
VKRGVFELEKGLYSNRENEKGGSELEKALYSNRESEKRRF